MSAEPDTYFASPERLDRPELQHGIDAITSSPIFDSIMHTVGGLVLVLNEQRQILAANTSLLKYLGVSEPESVLGMRPGEVIKCIHADEMPAGCGTSKYCSTCGFVVALVTSLESHTGKTGKCFARVKKDKATVDLCLNVHAIPTTFKNENFILVFIQDITQQEHRAELENVFFHDMGNLLAGVSGGFVALKSTASDAQKELISKLETTCNRMATEFSIQKVLAKSEITDYKLYIEPVKLDTVMSELRGIFDAHPAAKDKTLAFPNTVPNYTIETDVSLLLRILTNMVVNALEASGADDRVKVSLILSDGWLTFSVWNSQAMPPEIARRIFQKHFTTKDTGGHGFGTYSMKLFGERLLGGKVNFVSTEREGTKFTLSLPL